MPTEAFIGSQSLFKIGSGSPATYTTVFEVVNIGEFGQESDLIEATHLQSLAKEYVNGLPDGIEFTVAVNFKPSDTTHKALLDAQVERTIVPIQVVMPPPPFANSEIYAMDVLVRAFRIGAITANAVVPATFTMKISGPITLPA